MNIPFLYKEQKPLVWSFRDLHEFFQHLEELGVSREFLFHADKKGAALWAPPETVNLVKLFLFEQRLHKKSDYARSVITSAHCPVRPDPPLPRPRPEPDPQCRPGHPCLVEPAQASAKRSKKRNR